MSDSNTPAFLQSKFDNICLMVLIVFLVCLLTWADKHNNGDYVKWLEVFSAGIGGAYLGLITASRQAWAKQNGQPPPPPPATALGLVQQTPKNTPLG